ncbi:peptide-N(4)-(N-acetyl-beta-glucosaminyl)asparagine amidase-like [Amaranthus tricolor]|uniref:peptide-N(4)-(N-acetyl-beta- glucosaminyl)asparagine amidase-like n=1 Tax=Amaranthus tricolor TaxID=29722 RepID=UPI002582E2C6|nr:peptide-N(4)-(N-acetyl-beta-glucosaminyl)asparagine amidase-like [Amaranthus tricolor]
MSTMWLLVRTPGGTFDVRVDDTNDGLEVFKFQLFSLTSIPPDEQKIVSGDDSRIIYDDSDLISISNKLRLLSINDDTVAESSTGNSQFNEELLKADEEFAQLLQVINVRFGSNLVQNCNFEISRHNYSI